MNNGAAARIGVDVGGTTTRAVRFDDDMTPVASGTAPTPHGAERIASLITELVGAVAPGDTAGGATAVCMPGRVDVRTGRVADAVNLGIDGSVEMASILRDRLGVAVHLENDVNAAALGAFHRLGVAHDSSLAYVNIGTGIAAGFVLGGRLLRGASGGAGEIGHIPMRVDGPPCPCGQVGCAEAIGSGRAVGTDPARRDDALAALAWTVQLCVMTLDVDVVAIGGGLTEQGQPFLDALQALLAEKEASSSLLQAAGLGRRVVLAPAGEPLGSLGAVLAARHALGGARGW